VYADIHNNSLAKNNLNVLTVPFPTPLNAFGVSVEAPLALPVFPHRKGGIHTHRECESLPEIRATVAGNFFSKGLLFIGAPCIFITKLSECLEDTASMVLSAVSEKNPWSLGTSEML